MNNIPNSWLDYLFNKYFLRYQENQKNEKLITKWWMENLFSWFFIFVKSRMIWIIKKKILTFSGNHGVTNGIWNVLQYEWRVSKESGDTAPSIEKTPRENWLQTEKKNKKNWRLNLTKKKKTFPLFFKQRTQPSIFFSDFLCWIPYGFQFYTLMFYKNISRFNSCW